MNAKVLSSLEKSYIQLDWKDYICKIEMTAEQMVKIIDLIEIFGSNLSSFDAVKDSFFIVFAIMIYYNYSKNLGT